MFGFPMTSLFRSTESLMTGGVIGAIVGALGKWLLDQWAANSTARRQMTESITTQVEQLAKDYYWKLANYASVLSQLLTDHIKEKEVIIEYQTEPQLLRYNLRQIHNSDKVTEKAKEGFFYYAKLMKITHDFQWTTGNTYFLKHFWAGKALTSLYNRLAELWTEVNAYTVIKHIDIDGKIDGLTDFITRLDNPKNEDLKREFENFKEWLDNEENLLKEARDLLHAYKELFDYELAILHKSWFKKVQLDVQNVRLPKKLSLETRVTIKRVAEAGSELRAPGRYREAAGKPKEEAPTKEKPPIGAEAPGEAPLESMPKDSKPGVAVTVGGKVATAPDTPATPQAPPPPP